MFYCWWGTWRHANADTLAQRTWAAHRLLWRRPADPYGLGRGSASDQTPPNTHKHPLKPSNSSLSLPPFPPSLPPSLSLSRGPSLALSRDSRGGKSEGERERGGSGEREGGREGERERPRSGAPMLLQERSPAASPRAQLGRTFSKWVVDHSPMVSSRSEPRGGALRGEHRHHPPGHRPGTPPTSGAKVTAVDA